MEAAAFLYWQLNTWMFFLYLLDRNKDFFSIQKHLVLDFYVLM